jgi:hypothetical protein
MKIIVNKTASRIVCDGIVIEPDATLTGVPDEKVTQGLLELARGENIEISNE